MNQHAKRRQAMRPPPDAPPPALPEPKRPLLPEPTVGEHRFEATADLVGTRLDRFLSEALAREGLALSRSRLKTLIEGGHVTIDGVAVRDPAVKAKLGQSVALDAPAAIAATPSPESIPLSIVFEDEHLVILDKQAGLVVHPAAGHADGTLVNALLAHCGDSLSGVGGVRRPGIVHRLDKDTTGLMVVAKTDGAHRGLSELFQDHGRSLGLLREYKALVWGAPERPSGVVDAPLGRHPHAREKRAVVRSGGRAAITHWRTESTFVGTCDRAGEARPPIAALVQCRLETGRTHQIRVHLASLGHPVMGDSLYAAGFRTKAERLAPAARAALEALNRQALHAAVLGFPHPITGVDLAFESPLPPDMAALVDALSRG